MQRRWRWLFTQEHIRQAYQDLPKSLFVSWYLFESNEFTLCWDLSIQYGENPTPVTFKYTKVDLEGYAPTSHAEYLALIDQDETLLNASVNQLDDIVNELAEGMDI